MIIVLVKYFCKENSREKFLGAIKSLGIDKLSREENGNIRYEYSFDAENSSVLILNEIWTDMEAVRLHGEEEHFRKLGEIKSDYVEKTEIKRFRAEEFSL